MRKINVISLFPKLVSQALDWGIVGQSLKHNIFQLQLIDPREFTEDKHRTVDDRPYGGGDGMILMAEPLVRAMDSLGDSAGVRVFLSPHGQLWNDSLAREFSSRLETSNLTLVCGRYGGVDQRFLNSYIDYEISAGDYVLSGGEFAALILIDSIARFLPGVLGNEQSTDNDSFFDGLLEAPQFTRPVEFLEQIVPEILRSGDHQRIHKFRHALSIAVTRERRPDLLAKFATGVWLEARLVLRQLSREELMTCGLSAQSVDEIFL